MSQELKIALLQVALVWEDPEQNRSNFERLIDDISEDTDIVVFPEMFTTGFTMTPANIKHTEGQKTVRWMQGIARERGMALLGSLSYYENNEYTNRLFFVSENEPAVYYDKRHTFTLAGEDKIYKAGKSKLIVSYKGFKLCPMICYDLRFPVWARNAENYDALIYVANWPTPRINAWDTLLKARAIENMSYSIGVNRVGADINGYEYCGHSSVYDCLGKQLCFSKEETILYATLDKQHIKTTRQQLNFLADRDTFNLVIQ